MKGSIIGDIIGSAYEWDRVKHKDFELFTPKTDYTDDSVLTIAVADAIINKRPYKETIHQYARAYPGRGYGGRFAFWIRQDDPKPYNSFGNGSAMRVSPVGFAFDTEEEVLKQAALSAEPSHNHPEGIKGAQATALSIFLARTGSTKQEIKERVSDEFSYNMDRNLAEIRPSYQFNETCQLTVPEAIIAFLESTDYEDAIRNAISLGGDSDTLACITGGIAEAYYKKIPEELEPKALAMLDSKLTEITDSFYQIYIKPD